MKQTIKNSEARFQKVNELRALEEKLEKVKRKTIRREIPNPNKLTNELIKHLKNK